MVKKIKENAPKTSSIKSMEDLLRKQSFRPPKKGQEVEAKIIFISKRRLLFDIGWKSYAALGELETKELTTYLPYLKVGDKIRAKVVVEESKDGFPVVSMRKFFEKGKWEILGRKQKNEEEINVLAGEYGKGGVFVDFMGIRGVIPKIQLTEEYINNPEKIKGQKIKVKVLEVDQRKNRLVVSQRAVALGISYKKMKEKFDKIKIGEKCKASVIGFSEFGVFCEVDKIIEGLIHISEISWEKVTDPIQHVKVGDELDVIVTEKNETNLKLNLSIKRLTSDPWENIEKKYPRDKEIEGTVMRKERYGYIIKFEPGVEGLLHVSKLSNDKELKNGETIKLFVEKIEPKNRRMSLIPVVHEKPVVYR
jgi:ribosomal protein S1